MQIDKIGFNVKHWSLKTEKEFLAEYEKDVHRPLGYTKEQWKSWLIDASAAIKFNSAPEEVKSKSKK